jgi:hypothetical protein
VKNQQSKIIIAEKMDIISLLAGEGIVDML